MEAEKPKTFEQVSSKIEGLNPDSVGVHVETAIYLPGLISEDGCATIKELMLLALAKSWVQAHNKQLSTPEEIRAELSKQTDPVTVALEEIPQMFAKAAASAAMTVLEEYCTNSDETLGELPLVRD